MYFDDDAWKINQIWNVNYPLHSFIVRFRPIFISIQAICPLEYDLCFFKANSKIKHKNAAISPTKNNEISPIK